MVEIDGRAIDLSDPQMLLLLVAGAAVAMLLLVLLAARRAARQGSRALEEIAAMGQRVEALARGQHELAGSLGQAVEAQAAREVQLLRHMESRLAEVTRQLGETLAGSAQRTARSLGELRERLETIDRAQAKIEKLSGEVLSLQDILSNKQARGAFGEIQLNEIVGRALPPDAYRLQATLSNGRRVDCLILLPTPPGPIPIDAKFPLEAWEAYLSADPGPARERALAAFRTAVRGHIRAIAERYLIPGETADAALMFLPSEAIHAELHARLPEVVREGFAARVFIVSPTTCMATLNTMRAVLKDAQLKAEAGRIRRELALLVQDLGRLGDRVANLDRHFSQAQRDVAEIRISAEKAGRRAARLDAFDFAEGEEDTPSARIPDRDD